MIGADVSSGRQGCKRKVRNTQGSGAVRRKGRSTSSKALQVELPRMSGWGGRRKGAGRKSVAARGNVPHRVRPEHCGRHPLHVTLRSAFRPLRSPFVFPTLRGAIRDVTRRWEKRFRVVEFSVQHDHLHLLLEATDKRALSGGLRALAISVSRRVNRLVSRSGRLWADRWHARALTSPRAVRHAIVYVLFNFRKHGGEGARGIDPYSSAPYFAGFAEASRAPPRAGAHLLSGRDAADSIHGETRTGKECPVVVPNTWLLRVGWRRHGLIGRNEHPRSMSSER